MGGYIIWIVPRHIIICWELGGLKIQNQSCVLLGMIEPTKTLHWQLIHLYSMTKMEISGWFLETIGMDFTWYRLIKIQVKLKVLKLVILMIPGKWIKVCSNSLLEGLRSKMIQGMTKEVPLDLLRSNSILKQAFTTCLPPGRLHTGNLRSSQEEAILPKDPISTKTAKTCPMVSAAP